MKPLSRDGLRRVLRFAARLARGDHLRDQRKVYITVATGLRGNAVGGEQEGQ